MNMKFDILISMQDGRIQLRGCDFALKETSTGRMEGECLGMKVYLSHDEQGRLTLTLINPTDMACESLGWSLIYRDDARDLSLGRVHCFGKSVDTSGMPRLCDVKITPQDSAISGLFLGAKEPCLFLGTELPQSFLHLYQAKLVDEHEVEFTGVTYFPVGMRTREVLTTEKTYLIDGMTPLAAMQKYAEHIPNIPTEKLAAPLVGWNSWDYYFATVSAEAIKENLEAIAQVDILRDAMKCVIVDDGWESCVGDWYPNHRFPEGLEKLASDIREKGMVPGIWTNGAQVQTLSYPGLRCGEMFIKKPNGEPLIVDGMFVLDPTHPKTEKYLFELYSRLYKCGFRIFKVDFVSEILNGEKFHDANCGPYDAIRRVFEIVRRAVGEDSHIIGCSYPAECGAGYVDSSRISVDIHNQWAHVCWVMEYMQNHFWCNGKLYRNDADMLIVRGTDTSLEEETNVYNPFEFAPKGTGNIANRWRRGKVFDIYEAETWANLVVCSGGNIMSGDRISMLNEKGKELLCKHLEPQDIAAVPLDFGEGEIASLWYTDMGKEKRLLLINLAENERVCDFCFEEYGIPAPKDLRDEKNGTYENGVFRVKLHRHESTVVCWE